MPLPSIMSLMVARTSGASSLLTGLRVYYTLNDETEASGTGLTLTNQNTVTFSAGKVGNAANFVAASSQKLYHLSNAAYEFDSSTSWTMACWLKFTASAIRGVCWGSLNSGGWGVRLSDQVIARVNDGGGHDISVSSPSTYDDGNWHFVALTADRSGNLTLYVDNASVGMPASMASMGGFSGDTFNIGADTSLFYDGSIDEVGLWSRVLTADELSTLWNSGNGITYPFT